MKNQRKYTEEELAKYEAWSKEDGDKWETGELGRDPNHTKRAPKELEDFINATKSKHISIKLPPLLIAKLKRIAGRDNIGYQTYIRQMLTKHVRLLEEEDEIKKSG